MNSSELWSAAHRAWHTEDPAVLLRAARTLRVVLGAVLVVQFLFPAILPPLFTTWVVPWLAAPPAHLTRTSYLLGLTPWILLATLQVVHARLLRHAGFPLDDGQVVSMTLLPAYNVAGTLRLFAMTGRALVAVGAPAGLTRELGWASGTAVALGVAVPLEWAYVLGSAWVPVVGTELFVGAFLLLSARLYLLARLHSAFSAEPVRSALLAAGGSGQVAAATPATTSTTTPAVTFAAAHPTWTPAPMLRTAVIGGGVAVLLALALFLGFRLRRDRLEEAQRVHQEALQASISRRADEARASRRAAAADVFPSPAPTPRPPPGEPEPAAVALAARLAAAPGPTLPEPPEPLFGGRTAKWWEERIAQLRSGIGEDRQRLADLTIARARANGLTVDESAGSVRVTPPARLEGRP